MNKTKALLMLGLPSVMVICYLTVFDRQALNQPQTLSQQDALIAESETPHTQDPKRVPAAKSTPLIASESEDEAQLKHLKKEQELILQMAASLDQNPAMILDPLAQYFEKHDFIRDFPEYSKKLEDLAQMAVHGHNPQAVQMFLQQAKMAEGFTMPLYEQVLIKRKPGIIATEDEDIKLSAILHWQDCVTSIENYQKRLAENTTTPVEAPLSAPANSNN